MAVDPPSDNNEGENDDGSESGDGSNDQVTGDPPDGDQGFVMDLWDPKDPWDQWPLFS